MAKKFDIGNAEKESISAYFQKKKPEEKETKKASLAPVTDPVKTPSKSAEKQPIKASPTPSGKDLDKWVCRYCKAENEGGKACSACGKNKLVEQTIRHRARRPEREDDSKKRSKRVQLLTTEESFSDLDALTVVFRTSLNDLINKIIDDYRESQADLISDARKMADSMKKLSGRV